MSAVLKFMTRSSVVEKRKTAQSPVLKERLMGNIPKASTDKRERRPKAVPRSVQAPKGFPILPGKLPEERMPGKIIFNTAKSVTSVREAKSAIMAESAREVEENVTEHKARSRTPSKMKPKVPTSK